MATDTQNLLQWLLDLLDNDQARQDFLDDPDRYLDLHGYGDVNSGDIYDALCLAADDNSYSHRDNDDDRDHGDHHPAPHHYDKDEDAGHYLREYITNNYTYVDDRDNNVDNSIHQKIDTDGGDFDQTIDNDTVIASGDGSVAAGGDIRDSTVTTGDGNVVGDDNQAVTGDDNTTAFGSGDATDANFEDARFGDGSGVSLGGNAEGSNEDNDSVTSVRGGDGDTAVNTASNDASAGQSSNQADTDASVDVETDDHSETNTHNDVLSHNDVSVDDSTVDAL